MSDQETVAIIQRFDGIWWHDSKLFSLSFYRKGSEEQVKISVGLRGPGEVFTPTEIIFKDTAYIASDVYLAAEHVCADDISSGCCYASSDWIKSLSERNPYDSFDGYFTSRPIYLCPPGGTINILATDFAIEPQVSVGH